MELNNGHITSLSIPDLIIKKRKGYELTRDEIEYFVRGIVDGYVQEAQLGAMLMAMVLKDLTDKETTYLTRAMVISGETLNWPASWQGTIVDKHSTGGVGDKISLVLTPALTACGMKVPMISGRGLVHTGGTLDKLESIPGFNVSVTIEQMHSILNNVGCCIVGQTTAIDPADKIMYATRDVTGTTDHIGLIAASIISKKAAASINALVLDVKCGNGAFFKDERSSRELAEKMVATGNGLGINTVALLTSMDVPIGRTIGNALEVAEAIQCLQGNGPDDIMELVINLGGHLLHTSGKVASIQEGFQIVEAKLRDQSALQTFVKMIQSQGVDNELAINLCDKNTDVWTILPKANYITSLTSRKSGYIHELDAMACAIVSFKLGAGRKKSGDPINHAVGLELQIQIGDKISKGDTWVKIHHHDPKLPLELSNLLKGALVVKDGPIQRRSRIISVVS